MGKATAQGDLAWLAGLFEGEGSVGTSLRPNGQRQPFLTIHMTDLDVVERAARIWGGYAVKNSAPSRRGKKESWRTGHHRWDDVARWGLRLSPWLGERRLRAVADFVELNQLRREFGTNNSRRWTLPRGTATHCKRGHERTEVNTYVQKGGGLRCRPCHNLLERRKRAR